MTLDQVLQEVKQERESQDKIWNPFDHNPLVWLSILGEEVGEVNKACISYSLDYFNHPDEEFEMDNLRDELIQVAAVAVAFIESIDRTKGKINKSKQVGVVNEQPKN